MLSAILVDFTKLNLLSITVVVVALVVDAFVVFVLTASWDGTAKMWIATTGATTQHESIQLPQASQFSSLGTNKSKTTKDGNTIGRNVI